MGVSISAIIAFGFDLGNEADLPNALLQAGATTGGFDFSAVVARHLGLSQPNHANHSPAWTAYWTSVDDGVKAFPVTLIKHCTAHEPMYFLAVQGTQTRARLGEVEAVTLGAVSTQQVEAFRAFCDRYGVAWAEPSWQFFSYWN